MACKWVHVLLGVTEPIQNARQRSGSGWDVQSESKTVCQEQRASGARACVLHLSVGTGNVQGRESVSQLVTEDGGHGCS